MKKIFQIIIVISIISVGVYGVSESFAQNYSIPDWIKTTAGWWADGLVGDSDFIGAIKFLIENDILQLSDDAPNAGELAVKIALLEKTVDSLTVENQNLKSKLAQLESSTPSTGIFDELISELETREKQKLEIIAQTNPFVKGIISGEIKIFVEPVPQYAAFGVSEQITKFTNFLTQQNPTVIQMRLVDNVKDADLVISWIRDYGSHTLGESIFKSHIKVGLGTNNCLGEWQAFDAFSISKILTHELGHSLGFSHSEDFRNIMYPTLKPEFFLEHKITDLMPENFWKSIPFCSGGTYSYSVSSEGEYDGFDLYVISQSIDPGDFFKNGGRYYDSCSALGKKSTGALNCTVDEASLLIKNVVDHAITVEITAKKTYTQIFPEMWHERDLVYDQKWLEDVWNLYH